MPELTSVSAILPVRDGARFVREALDCVHGQSVAVSEIIVIDDGSTDDTAARVRAWSAQRSVPVSLVTTARQGPAAARNTGVKAASYDLLTFLDVDDLWPPDKLCTQLAHLSSRPELDVLVGLVEFHCLPDASAHQRRLRDHRDRLTHYHVGSGLYRRRVFDIVGGFDPTMTFGEDTDWFLRAREEPRIRGARHPETALLYRLHPANMSNDHRGATAGMLRAIKRSTDRRRQRGELGQVPDFPLLAPVEERTA